MTATLFIGCILVAYGPPIVLLISYISRRSALLVLTIGSAFFWLFSILITSLIWLAIPPLQKIHVFPVIVGVIVQELVRTLLALVYAKSEHAADRLVRPGGPKLFNDLSAGIAAGIGYGLMHTIMMYGAVLTSSMGEAAWYYTTCPSINAYILNSILALFYNILHVLLTIITFDAYRTWVGRGVRSTTTNIISGIQSSSSSLSLSSSDTFLSSSSFIGQLCSTKNPYSRLTIAPILHILFSLATLLVQINSSAACIAELPLLALINIFTLIITIYIVQSPDYAAKRQMRAWEVLTRPRRDQLQYQQQQQRYRNGVNNSQSNSFISGNER